MALNSIFKSTKTWCIIFFAGYFILGCCIFDDYGISWDENVKRRYLGEATYDYIFKNDSLLFVYPTKYYGPIFDFTLVIIEKFFSLTDTRDLYFVRHLFTFLLFYISVVVFFFLCRKIFESDTWAIISCIILVISPHIFSHSFYNSTDIPFLSFFIFSIASLHYLIKNFSWFSVILHSFTTAMAIDIRILGVLIPVITIVLVAGEVLIKRRLSFKEAGLKLMVYFSLMGLLVLAFWPYLWPNPVKNFVEAFFAMRRYTAYGQPVLYMGQNIIPGTEEIPWHYIPVSMIVTIPLVYTLLFFSGIIKLVVDFIKMTFHEFYSKCNFFVVSLFLIFFPMVAVVILHSILYDSWRHLYFIYPFFVIIAVLGLRFLYQTFSAGIFKYLIVTTFVANLLFAIFFMINNHPFQNVYHNVLAGTNMQTVKGNFELDYWGLSFRQALEYIVKTDTSSHIRVAGSCEPGVYNGMILPEKDRSRITFVGREEEKDYFMTNYRWHSEDYDYKNEYYSIYVGNAKIMTVFKMTDEKK